jgi:hypothetical protein
MAWQKPVKRPDLTALAIFRQAESFHLAALHLAHVNNSKVPSLAAELAYPSMHLDCVSVELYLKCLLFEHSGAVVRGHDLGKLFSNLPAPRRKILSKR